MLITFYGQNEGGRARDITQGNRVCVAPGALSLSLLPFLLLFSLAAISLNFFFFFIRPNLSSEFRGRISFFCLFFFYKFAFRPPLRFSAVGKESARLPRILATSRVIIVVLRARSYYFPARGHTTPIFSFHRIAPRRSSSVLALNATYATSPRNNSRWTDAGCPYTSRDRPFIHEHFPRNDLEVIFRRMNWRLHSGGLAPVQ